MRREAERLATMALTNPNSIGKVPDDWTVQSIDSLCLKVTSGGTPLRNNQNFYRNGTIRWFKTKELNDWYIDESEEKITAEAVEKSSAKVFPPHTILMAMYGDGKTITSLGILRKESASNQACCALIVNPDICDYLYLFYALKYHRSDFIHIATGGAQRNLSGTLIRNFAIRVPPLPEQKTIARILSCLDDKIELNQQMNGTLEAIARAIFKSWFVDFDPVRAKMEGRQPEGMDAATADLFPDEFEDSPLGKIPKGWTIEQIRLRATAIQYGLTQSSSSNPVGPNFLRITDIQGGVGDWSKVPFCQASPEEHQRYRVQEGDIFVARTGASTGENIYIVDAPDAVFASYLVRFQFAEPYTARVVGAFMRTASYFDYVAGAIGGSAQPNASAQVLAGATLVFSSPNIAQRFYQTVRPLDMTIAANQRQSRTLSSIRDTLLPKLLSGEIRVKDAEKLM